MILAAGALTSLSGWSVWGIRAVFLLMIIAGSVMIFLSRRGQGKMPLEEDLKSAVRGCREYDALVLDVHKETEGRKKRRVIILQIRFEQQRRTVVHKCTEKFFRKYSRGQHVPVFFREDTPVDFCMLKYDNIFVMENSTRLFHKHLLMIMGSILVIAGAIGQFIIIGYSYLPG